MALRLAVRKPRAVRLPAPAARLFAEIAKMQPEAWPLLQHHWSRPEPFVTFRRYLESIQASCADGSRFASLGSIPVTVISGAHLTPAQLAENERWARTSSAGRHIAAPRGRHWIHLDVPDLVLEEAKRLSSDRHV
jgi:pimeloyl-ACP methyl ester carboxylesterase